MELCVLIPDELSLTVNNVIAKIDKAMCTIVSNMRITKGTRFKPMQGTIRYVKVNLTVILLDCFFFVLFSKLSSHKCDVCIGFYWKMIYLWLFQVLKS